MKLFSASNLGAYDYDKKEIYEASSSWPSDLVELTDEEYNEFFLLTPPLGKQLSSLGGSPAWVDIESRSPVDVFKAERPAIIQAIKVTVDDMVFDGDEVSQTRMSRAVVVMDDLDTTTWVLANNTPATVTKAQLKAALRLAGEAQTAAWVFS